MPVCFGEVTTPVPWCQAKLVGRLGGVGEVLPFHELRALRSRRMAGGTLLVSLVAFLLHEPPCGCSVVGLLCSLPVPGRALPWEGEGQSPEAAFSCFGGTPMAEVPGAPGRLNREIS